MEVAPARQPLQGELRVPGDKSISHRALLLNALGRGPAGVRGLLDSEDVRASSALVAALGCEIEEDGGVLRIQAPSRLCEPTKVLDCGNSGTTMRIGLGLLANVPGLAVLTGDASLSRRPMGRVIEPMQALGVEVWGRGGGRAPICKHGVAGHPARLDLPIASAQVKSAALLGGRNHGVTLREPRRSRDHTERMLRDMGANLEELAGWLVLEPGPWDAVDVDVPGDFSSAAFWLVGASIVGGSHLWLPEVGINPTRTGALDALKAMGAEIQVHPHAGSSREPRADLEVQATALKGIRIDGELALRCIDELPILAIAAAVAEGETVIADAAELRTKESDRISRVVDGLRALGAEAEETADGMVIEGGGFAQTEPVRLDAMGDHRLAMAFAMAALVSRQGVAIDRAEVVNTSYPTFFEELARVRG